MRAGDCSERLGNHRFRTRLRANLPEPLRLVAFMARGVFPDGREAMQLVCQIVAAENVFQRLMKNGRKPFFWLEVRRSPESLVGWSPHQRSRFRFDSLQGGGVNRTTRPSGSHHPARWFAPPGHKRHRRRTAPADRPRRRCRSLVRQRKEGRPGGPPRGARNRRRRSIPPDRSRWEG